MLYRSWPSALEPTAVVCCSSTVPGDQGWRNSSSFHSLFEHLRKHRGPWGGGAGRFLRAKSTGQGACRTALESAIWLRKSATPKHAKLQRNPHEKRCSKVLGKGPPKTTDSRAESAVSNANEVPWQNRRTPRETGSWARGLGHDLRSRPKPRTRLITAHFDAQFEPFWRTRSRTSAIWSALETANFAQVRA